MTLVGYLLILLPLFSMYILFLEGKKFNVQKFFNKKKTDYTKEIKELSDLCKEGVITQEEFERKKKELLDLK
ncbi:MAG: SHOCT domain-containing protein [Erysipelotrichaceae bacterium]|nr:SHOCT domain-containing protein [Erysipelotrichaceae bacterium]